MPEALALVKRELGPDAVILGTRTLTPSGLPGWPRRARVEITAAPASTPSGAPRLRGDGAMASSAASTGKATGAGGKVAPLSPDGAAAACQPDLPQHLYPYYVRLVQNEVAAELAADLVRQAAVRMPTGTAVDEAALRAIVCQYIAALVPTAPETAPSSSVSRRIALVGPSGSGKTTTVAKLAAQLKLREGKRVALLSLDAHRLGAHEHLRRYADILEVPLGTAQTIAEVKPALKSLGAVDVLLIDTPGVGPREQGRFARLATLLRAARPDKIHLVLPASLAPDVQVRLAQGFAPLGLARLVLTRLDDVVGVGVILNVAQRLNLRLSYLSAGQNVPSDLEKACNERVAELLLTSASPVVIGTVG